MSDVSRNMLSRALNAAQTRGATYADIRVVRRDVETIVVKNGKVESFRTTEDVGFGVQVISQGAWGSAASSVVNAKEMERVAVQAVRIAKASSSRRRDAVRLSPLKPVIAKYRTPIKKDPFLVPANEKISLLIKCTEDMKGVDGIVTSEASIECQKETKVFASTDGSFIEQELSETGCSIECSAAGNDDLQRRSYPDSNARQQGTEGWELVERYDLAGNARRIAEEAVALLTAKACPSEVTTVILDSKQMALQIHESCGHAVELDRVLGMEAGFAGTSFLKPENIGQLRYGSELVNLTADGTVPGGLGTFGYDDEGVPAQRAPLVKNGMLVGFLTSRETAAQFEQLSNGTARADGWPRIPLIRMTNINLEPGTWKLDDMIASTDHGILMSTNKSWSIDDRRLNFQFGTEVGWEINNGKLGALLKNCTYTGITPDFWKSCDAIGNKDHWQMWGTPNCGKGQPEQVAHVGHGSSPARFRNVRVGIL